MPTSTAKTAGLVVKCLVGKHIRIFGGIKWSNNLVSGSKNSSRDSRSIFLIKSKLIQGINARKFEEINFTCFKGNLSPSCIHRISCHIHIIHQNQPVIVKIKKWF